MGEDVGCQLVFKLYHHGTVVGCAHATCDAWQPGYDDELDMHARFVHARHSSCARFKPLCIDAVVCDAFWCDSTPG